MVNFTEFSQINEAIDLLIDIKNIFRQVIPTTSMKEMQIQRVKIYLTKLNRIITKLNTIYGIQSLIEPGIKLNFKEVTKNILFIINSSKNRKKLIDFGIGASQIQATGGPIDIDDIKILNPTISEPSIQSIQSKIQKFWKKLETKIEFGNFNKLVLLLEENNIADKILLKRKEDFEKRVSIPLKIITITSFDQLTYQTFSSL